MTINKPIDPTERRDLASRLRRLAAAEPTRFIREQLIAQAEDAEAEAAATESAATWTSPANGYDDNQ